MTAESSSSPSPPQSSSTNNSEPSKDATKQQPHKPRLDNRHKQGISVAKKLRDQRKDEANQRRSWVRQRIAGALNKFLTSTAGDDPS
ncbi:hypothetical protein AN958_00865 [Leucoagaricus sp. SymC.cos]|nr:hypothetical protein AN958_00865 [Leucoagaricus sp. SymC.cos]